MYHYTNQSIYNHDVYQQCSLVSLNKVHNQSGSVAVQNEYNPNPQNLSVNTPPEASHSAPAPAELKPKRKARQAKTVKTEKPVKKAVVDTSNFSIEERLVAAVWVHERERTHVGMSEIKYDFRQRFGRDPPAKNTLLAWERKLFATGSVHDAPRTGRPVNRLKRLEEVLESVRAAPALSVRARARALRLPPSTLRALLRTDLPTAGARDNTGKPEPGTHVKPKRQTKKKTPAANPIEAVAPPAPLAYAPLDVHPQT